MSAAAFQWWDPEWPKDGSKPDDMKASARRAVRNFADRDKPRRPRFGRRCPQGLWRRFIDFNVHKRHID